MNKTPKRTLTFAIAAIALPAVAQATLLVSDGFNNANGTTPTTLYNNGVQVAGQNPTGSGQLGWGGAWSVDGTDDRWRTEASNYATYSDGTNSVTRIAGGDPGRLAVTGGTGFESISRNFASGVSGEVYYSFQVAVVDGDTDTIRISVGGSPARRSSSSPSA